VEGYHFTVSLTVRVGDLNYANHVGYQHYLSYFQDARLAYLGALGYSELDIGGCGILVSRVVCQYKQELFLNDTIQVGCRVSQLKSKGFRIDYRIERKGINCAEGHTDCLCFDPRLKKVAPLPAPFIAAVRDFEGI
jgi:YbgC/YbaW family acyl-CoA thioester hydrolase